MRLGVVMTGAGAHAAASVGVMRELERRGITPYAVCGLQSGAWPAALFAAGLSMDGMEKALHQAARAGSRMIAPGWYERLTPSPARMPIGARLNHLLSAQTGQRILSLCPGAAVFPCRMARTGQRVLFSTRGYMLDGGEMLAMQASVGFAARAAMGLAPFLAPVQYMGSALLGETDVAFACRQLMLLGAHRVLVIEPAPSPRRVPDALDLAACAIRLAAGRTHEQETGVLRVTMPDAVGALSLSRLGECALAGEAAAARELDDLFNQMGMARCRVLAFRRRYS
ncbi:MAG: hypothetical protein IJ313_05805 [Clostridia bacterium]|nr:hypothetical protein [Clostridia bacterium]